MTEEENEFPAEEKGKETGLEGSWVREKLKRWEDNLIKQSVLREQVNLEPTIPTQWEKE